VRLGRAPRTGIAISVGVLIGILLRPHLGGAAILVAVVLATLVDLALRRWEARG
jgi:hypothetical protein